MAIFASRRNSRRFDRFITFDRMRVQARSFLLSRLRRAKQSDRSGGPWGPESCTDMSVSVLKAGDNHKKEGPSYASSLDDRNLKASAISIICQGYGGGPSVAVST